MSNATIIKAIEAGNTSKLVREYRKIQSNKGTEASNNFERRMLNAAFSLGMSEFAGMQTKPL